MLKMDARKSWALGWSTGIGHEFGYEGSQLILPPLPLLLPPVPVFSCLPSLRLFDSSPNNVSSCVLSVFENIKHYHMALNHQCLGRDSSWQQRHRSCSLTGQLRISCKHSPSIKPWLHICTEIRRKISLCRFLDHALLRGEPWMCEEAPLDENRKSPEKINPCKWENPLGFCFPLKHLRLTHLFSLHII